MCDPLSGLALLCTNLRVGSAVFETHPLLWICLNRSKVFNLLFPIEVHKCAVKIRGDNACRPHGPSLKQISISPDLSLEFSAWESQGCFLQPQMLRSPSRFNESNLCVWNTETCIFTKCPKRFLCHQHFKMTTINTTPLSIPKKNLNM